MRGLPQTSSLILACLLELLGFLSKGFGLCLCQCQIGSGASVYYLITVEIRYSMCSASAARRAGLVDYLSLGFRV